MITDENISHWQYSKSRIISKLKEKGISLTKARGQNFLIDKNILTKMISNLVLDDHNCIIEIGPGIGNLTNFLAKLDKELYLIELDKKIYEILIDTFSYNKLIHIINEDFLKTDIGKLIHPNKKGIVVSNIPYYLTSKIIEKCFLSSRFISDLYLLMQKEVAERITSEINSKNYGSISVFAQTYSIVEILFEVTANSFFPKPKVASSFVHFRLLGNKVESKIMSDFSSFVKKVFGYRRKSISTIFHKYILPSYDKSFIEEELSKKLNILPRLRPENISPEKYLAMWKYYNAHKSIKF